MVVASPSRPGGASGSAHVTSSTSGEATATAAASSGRLGSASASVALRRGRPRDPAVDEAILRATLDLVAEVGLSGLTVDAVAARAGVGKATIYRRWPSKEALLFVAVATVGEEPPTPDTGRVDDDLLALYDGLVDSLGDQRQGRVVVEMAAAAAQDPALMEIQRDFVQRRRETGRAILRRGIERGELRPDLDLDLVLDVVVGPAVHRCFLSHQPITRVLLESTVDLVLSGARAVPRLEDRGAPPRPTGEPDRTSS